MPDNPIIGTQIGTYKILEKLGEGGMGVVYKGVDVNLDRVVAIKALSAELNGNPELEQRFRTEARSQANLNHTNLATLYALLVDNGRPWMVMEYIEGETFEQMVQRRGPVPAQEAIPLFRQALLGIGYAHQMGIVHRDIKPSNIMVNKQGIVKVMDFGIAKVLGARGMTKTGTQMGTAFYMSPEQVLNRGVDMRSDTYSLGVTLYELLTANVPFSGDSDYQVMTDHVNSPPPLPTKFYPYIPQGVQNAVLKALEKSPEARFQTAEEFSAALGQPDTFGVVKMEVIPPAPSLAGRTVVETGTRAAAPVIVTPPQAAVVTVGQGSPAAVPHAALPSKPGFWTPERRIAIGGAALLILLIGAWAALRPHVPNSGLPPAPPEAKNVQQPQQPPTQDLSVPPLPPVKTEPQQPPPKVTENNTTPPPAPPAFQTSITIPAGTPVTVRLLGNVDSSRNQIGQRFDAVVDAPIVVEGRQVIARGAGAQLLLAHVQQVGHIAGRSEVRLELVSVTVNGTAYAVRSNLYEKLGAPRGKRSAGVIAGGAAVGAAIGGIFGHKKGAAIGAASGAGAGTAVQMSTSGETVIVPAETRIRFTLRTPINTAP